MSETLTLRSHPRNTVVPLGTWRFILSTNKEGRTADVIVSKRKTLGEIADALAVHTGLPVHDIVDLVLTK